MHVPDDVRRRGRPPYRERVSDRAAYRSLLAGLPSADWADLLRRESHLPGPRANLELVQAVAEEAPAALVDALCASDDEYLVLCGAVATGRLLAGAPGARGLAERLRTLAADPRWRVREGVAMALQRLGDDHPDALAALARTWAADADPLVVRAAVAGVCEPRLLGGDLRAVALDVCDAATASLTALPQPRRSPSARTLRQALGYCWSVAVAAEPAAGLPRFAALDEGDADVAWVVRENRRKARLARLLDA